MKQDELEPIPERWGGLNNPQAQDMYFEDVWKALRVIIKNQEQIYKKLKSSESENKLESLK